ncbi:MAG: bifunctional riboflavin kinase/FAD synthetase [Candidatus Kapabacteria bacterium]|nr:bifunctional riboflavin kinase/FAD synthetase [Candidatus Kapabacteria bacterium]MDW8012940.1 bifunctional riboflavin kinase/FAD synthetase [Bacteroidota bacterium]
MRVYTHWSDVPKHSQGRLATVGTFDGVHRGHQALLEYLCRRAQELALTACVVTFEPHPQMVLGRRPPIGILTPLPAKLEHFRQIGIAEVVVAPFTTELARTSAEEFVHHYLLGILGIRGIVVGHDHMFGHERRGNLELLQQLGQALGFIVEHFPPFIVDGITVSSSTIRRALQQGDVETAAKLLGYPYTVCGTVVRGDGRGRRLGFPTANLQVEAPEQLLPAHGVYIATTQIAGRPYAGLVSYGVRPTFGNDLPPQLELYVLDFSGSLYNQRLCVSFWARVRAELPFPTPEALQEQMERDEAYCRTWIAEHRLLEQSPTVVSQPIHGDQGTES